MNEQGDIFSESTSIVGETISFAFDPLFGMNISDMSLPTQNIGNFIDYSGLKMVLM